MHIKENGIVSFNIKGKQVYDELNSLKSKYVAKFADGFDIHIILKEKPLKKSYEYIADEFPLVLHGRLKGNGYELTLDNGDRVQYYEYIGKDNSMCRCFKRV